MYCTNCGGEIKKTEAYCPYCGVMNPRAAEKEHMDKLEDIREDTEELVAETGHQAKLGVRKAGRRAVVIFGIVAVVIFGIWLFGWGMDHLFFGSWDRDVRQEAAFKAKYFPELDAIYAAGDDDATLDYMEGLYDQDGSLVLSMWDHYKYMLYYSDYRSIAQLPEQALDEDFWDYTYENILYAGIELILETDTVAEHGLSADEAVRVAGYQAEAERIFADCLGLDRAALEEIYRACVGDSDYFYIYKLHDWLKANPHPASKAQS